MDLELEMLSLGQEKAEERVRKAREKQDLTVLRPQRSLLHDWIVPVSEYLQAWISAQNKQKGPRSIAQRRLVRIPPDTAAVCALRIILKTLGLGVRNIISIAMEIGSWIEHEGRAVAWKQVEEDSWQETVKKYSKRGANAVHQKRARTSLFNKYIKERIGWVDWTDHERQHVGLALIACVCGATKRFTIEPDPAWSPKRGSKKPKSRPYVLVPEADLLNRIENSMEDELVFAPTFLPTVIPPKPWETPRDGGYWTPYVKTPFLIRFKAIHEEQRQKALEEFDALDMPQVYDAVNFVQQTAWQVNKRVLEVANALWQKDLGLKCMPKRENEKPLHRSAEEKADHETAMAIWEKMSKEEREANPQVAKAYFDWARRAGAIHKRNAKRTSKWLSAKETLKTANRMAQEECFYFPHMLDFRGRFYPIPSALQPQGNDLHKGLLVLHEGKKVPKEDAWWLAMNLANCYGIDKVDHDARVAWVEERNEDWFRIAEDPLGNLEWLEADGGDTCWCALAAILEWVGYLKDPEGFITHLPVRVDGSCNGIQHLAAMVRDEDAGAAVNLVPGDKPQDIYTNVADEVTKLLEDAAMADEPQAHIWLAVFEGHVKRSVTKRPVMIVPYGGTIHAYFEYTMEWLEENDPGHQMILPEEVFKMCGYLVKLIAKAMEGRIGRSMEVMRWLKDCCAKACSKGKALTWTAPSGFYVRQFYGTMEGRRVKTLIDGQTYMLQVWDASKKLDMEAQGKAIAPNFVHSMDASCLVLTVNKFYRGGYNSITTIHDSYGALAPDMWALYGCIREAFIENYATNVLEDFLGWCHHVNPRITNWKDIPQRGELDLELVRESDYFFA